MINLPDVQERTPDVQIGLKRVGITNLILPVLISQKIGEFQRTVANISCYVDLEKDKKGINMSRLPVSLHKFTDVPINGTVIQDIAELVRTTSNATTCYVSYQFDYFIKKLAPVSKEPGFINHKVRFRGTKTQDSYEFSFVVECVGTSLCPCSKEISNFSAHNQKCFIVTTIYPVPKKIVWIEDIVEISEQSASCEIFSVLKRPDEKYVTEHAYNNPKFVEDIARDVYDKLKKNQDIKAFSVKVSSDESIHMHSAVAYIES